MSNVSSSNSQGVHVPKLRFPGFEGEWVSTILGSVFTKITEKNSGGRITNVICNSAKQGLIPQRDYFDKDIANADNTDGYYVIKQNDFVYNPRKSTEAPYGPVSVYRYQTDGIVSPLYLCFRSNSIINVSFYEWLFKSSTWHRYVYLSGDSGARHDRVSMKDSVFFNMPLFIPSSKEQHHIAAFLCLLESRIDKQHQLVEALKSYKRGVIFKAFIAPDNPFGLTRDTIYLHEILTEYRVRETTGLRVCSVAVNKGVIDQIEHLGRSFSASDTSKYGRVKPNDVIYTKSPTGSFPFGIVKQNHLAETVAVSPLYGVYTPCSNEVGMLLHTFFEQSQYANNYIRPLAQKGAKNTINITNSHFLDGKIIFPVMKKEQVQLATIFRKINAAILLQEQVLDALIAQKHGLLAILFI